MHSINIMIFYESWLPFSHFFMIFKYTVWIPDIKYTWESVFRNIISWIDCVTLFSIFLHYYQCIIINPFLFKKRCKECWWAMWITHAYVFEDWQQFSEACSIKSFVNDWFSQNLLFRNVQIHANYRIILFPCFIWRKNWDIKLKSFNKHEGIPYSLSYLIFNISS